MGIFSKKIDGIFGNHVIDTDVLDIDTKYFLEDDFCNVMIKSLYTKIFTECSDRTSLIGKISKSDFSRTVYDNYSPKKCGLITIIVDALVKHQCVYLRKIKMSNFNSYVLNVVDEKDAIKNDILMSDCIEINFRCYKESSVLRMLFFLHAKIMKATANSVEVSQGMLIKIYKLSEMISNPQNVKAVEEQIKSISNGIRVGKNTVIDSESDISFAEINTTPLSDASKYIFSLISTITGMPSSYLFGEVVGGLGSQQDGDNDRLNSSIKSYYNSIFAGIIEAIYGIRFEYKMQVSDMQKLIEIYSFIETTKLLNNEGKKAFLLNNTDAIESHLSL